MVTRKLATDLSKKWGQSVIVENKPGGTSIIGNNFVAKSPPDGYTLLAGFTALVQMPSLVKNIPYDVEKDLIPVTQTVSGENLLVVRADSPYQNMGDFIAAARTANAPATNRRRLLQTTRGSVPERELRVFAHLVRRPRWREDHR